MLHNLFTFHTYYQGPFSKDLNNVDIAWIVGLIVTSIAYVAFTRNLDVHAEQPAIERSEQELAEGFDLAKR